MRRPASPGADEVAAFRRRLEALRERARERVATGELPAAALEDLQGTLEELQVAQEELHAQNEELLAARGSVEQERRRYQELFESAPVGYLVTDPEGHVEEVNAAAEAVLGWPRTLLVGKPAVIMVALKDRRAFRTEL